MPKPRKVKRRSSYKVESFDPDVVEYLGFKAQTRWGDRGRRLTRFCFYDKILGTKSFYLGIKNKYLVFMPKNPEIDTGLQRLLDFAYGNHPKRQPLKIKGAQVVRFLRAGSKNLDELASQLGLSLNKPSEMSQFYAALRPLRETGMISTHRSKGKTFYSISYASFRFALEQLRKDAEYWLREEGRV